MPSRKDLANAIRILSIDAIQKARSGHPGAPMGMADIAEVLWNDFLKHNPNDPTWPDRDRFVLSNGHASMLLYSLLHLSGYNLSMEDIKNFRNLGSKTPGHPEYKIDLGIETTTGPLGQGLANAVGLAIAEKLLSVQFNRPECKIVDHFTYVFVGDGCLMEGISHEACSLAGTLGLGKLIAIYDDNNISIDGKVDTWFSENIPQRFESYGWQVICDVDGHDSEAVYNSILEAKLEENKPSLICCKTQIGYGSPNMCGSHKTHGAPLGEEEVLATRKNLGWKAEAFFIPQDIYEAFEAREKGEKAQSKWEETFQSYQEKYPELAQEFKRRMAGDFPVDFDEKSKQVIHEIAEKQEDMATRKASKQVLNGFGPLLPELLGGSADLTGSNQTFWSHSKEISKITWDGNYIHYGVREFGMVAIMNGVALHGGFIPYGGTFLVFSDYARSAIRMAALMGIRSLFVLTHDSIGVGEDGPTHQPIEQAASLRIIPNLNVWRPCDTVETAVAWKCALETQNAPSAILLSRQELKYQHRSNETLENISKGGYTIFEPENPLDALIIATGSEVDLAIQAAQNLQKDGYRVRVVSMPSIEVFETQSLDYKNKVISPEISARVVIEAAVSDIWHKYAGDKGKIIGLDRFGESAPGSELFEYFGFTVQNVQNAVIEVVKAINASS